LLLRLAREEPALFLQRFPPPLMIDEVQYAPGLFPLIKEKVDALGDKGLYWLTGSQSLHLMQQVSESLAGRVAVLHLQGLSLSEAMGQGAAVVPFLLGASAAFSMKPAEPALAWLYERIWRGAFPALHVPVGDPVDRDLFYGSYLQTYLQRDLRDLAQVDDLTAFVRFLRSAAARTAQLLNMTDMARDVGVSPNTVKHWLSILSASGLIWLMEPYHTNLSKRLVRAPKLYFLDTGLAAYLTEWSSPATLEAGAMAGGAVRDLGGCGDAQELLAQRSAAPFLLLSRQGPEGNRRSDRAGWPGSSGRDQKDRPAGARDLAAFLGSRESASRSGPGCGRLPVRRTPAFVCPGRSPARVGGGVSRNRLWEVRAS